MIFGDDSDDEDKNGIILARTGVERKGCSHDRVF